MFHCSLFVLTSILVGTFSDTNTLSPERSYFFTRNDVLVDDEGSAEAITGESCNNSAENATETVKSARAVLSDVYIDGRISDTETHVAQGVRVTSGDGTVPLLSLGKCRGRIYGSLL